MPILPAEFEVQYSSSMPHGTIELLESVEFGSDGLRYRRLGVADQLRRFNEPVYFSVYADGELTGVYVLDKRVLHISGRRIDGYYRASLAVHAKWQGMGAGKALARFALAWIDRQSLEAESFSYGCIDASNKRSLRVLSLQGASPVSSLSMYMMYRQWHRSPVELDLFDDYENWFNHDSAHRVYGEFSLRDVSKSSLPCFALSDEKGVAISACAVTVEFQITTMGTLADWMTRLFVTPWPPARARFDAQRFRYVSFSQVLVRPGSEARWPAFVSSVLAHYRSHFGAVYLDPATQLFSALRSVQGFSRMLYRPQSSIVVVGRASPTGSILLPGKPVVVWPVDA